MTISKNVRALLENAHINYQVLEHPPTFTALETAEAQHVPGRQVVKTVIVEADGKMLMCILSAVQKIDFSKLQSFLGTKHVRLASENEIASLFPENEIGAEPPFSFSGIKVYVDKVLEENDLIVFNGGTHTEMIRIKFKDYVRIAKPIFGDFGVHIE